VPAATAAPERASEVIVPPSSTGTTAPAVDNSTRELTRGEKRAVDARRKEEQRLARIAADQARRDAEAERRTQAEARRQAEREAELQREVERKAQEEAEKQAERGRQQQKAVDDAATRLREAEEAYYAELSKQQSN
jgi:colicin import membrane protein